MKSGKLNKVFVQLVKLWTMPVFRYGVKDGKFFAQVLPALVPEQGLDERIKRIDSAREHLVSGLSAINELKEEAETSARKVEELKSRLEYLASEKDTADLELREIQKIASSDLGAFQKIAGVPSRRQIAKERLVGFVIGLIASLLATVLWEQWSAIVAWF
ncbi:MAG: hypothetical protein VX595_01165 [Pseudomonadota bacterium]|uniref:hypothetical protein n=1 Tax=Alcanivorax sp. NBRC 102024 TaxID=1113895 RepID=UPI000789C7E6|nr:hypothetical protein [Alcanivorax sp. NBRC 102024]MEE2601645.1 hypothetical protein [Pseudomonadota bacterium]